MFGKRFAVGVLGVLAVALMWTASPQAVGATNPQAVGVLPVSTGAGVSAVRSTNPNVTAALYRPGGTSQVFWVETQAVTTGSNQQVYDPFFGTAVYTTVLTKPVTFNPINGTTTGERQGYDIVGPYTTTGVVYVPGGFPYGYYGPFIAR